MSSMEASAAIEQGTKRRFHIMEWDEICKRLVGKDMKNALKAGADLKEYIDIGQSKDSASMLATLIPAFSSVLSSITRPNEESLSDESNLRKMVLDIISRIPKDDALRPHAPALLEVSMDVLAKDYEENALLASKIIFDIHKNFRSMPQDQVQRYLDFVQQVYRSLPSSMQRNFHFISTEESTDSAPTHSEIQSSGNDQVASVAADVLGIQPAVRIDLSLSISSSSGLPSSPSPRVTVCSTSSFRVLTECPLTIMLLFQLYPKFLKTNIPSLIQLMMEALAIRAPPIQLVLKNKVSTLQKRLYYNRSRELIAAQVKTLSFLTYLLRGFAAHMKPYEDRIATNVISLMTSCPREALGTRKELMVATRHILATEFRKGFFRHVDSLLDERTLMGSHRHSDQSIIRPLGYSTLADLVLHVRSTLTMKQLSRVVFMFSRVLHDSSMKLSVSIQLTAIRVLLNMVDIIANNKDTNAPLGRDLLNRILNTLVNKLGTIKDSVKSVRQGAVLESRRKGLRSDNEVSAADHSAESDPDEICDTLVVEAEQMSKSKQRVETEGMVDADEWMVEGTSSFESIREMQSMVRSVVTALKTVVWCLANYRLTSDKGKAAPTADDPDLPSVRVNKFERDLIAKYIDFAIPCMSIYAPLSCGAGETLKSAWEQQERDVVTYFAACFTVLDSFTLRRTLGDKIGLLVDTIVHRANIMVFARHLLGSNSKTSSDFIEILLSHLVDQIDRLSIPRASDLVFLSDYTDEQEFKVTKTNTDVGRKLILKIESMSSDDQGAQEKVASIHLELFERIIKSLATFPENERALRPYLHKIVSFALRLSMEKEHGWPDNYCSLLRSVFRSISAGKFEDSYKELLPMIPILLNGLYRIYQSTEDEQLRGLVVEMCLTIPARLSTLLPHMPLLLRMIIASLNTNEGDLVNLGLRTLEFWIDNLNPEFLFPVLSRQTATCTSLMTALTIHLRPAPYPYGPLALRLLGKLGGKNRRFLRNEIALTSTCNQPVLAELTMEFQWCDTDSLILRHLVSKGDRPDLDPSRSAERFSMALPIDSAVTFLSSAAQIDLEFLKPDTEQKVHEDAEFKVVLKRISRKDLNTLLKESADAIDLEAYCFDVINDTVVDQTTSALSVICTSLAMILDLDEELPDLATVNVTEISDDPPLQHRRSCSADSLVSNGQRSDCLKAIVKGFLFGLSIQCIEKDSRVCAKGVFHYMLGVLTSLSEHVIKIDANGSRLSKCEAVDDNDTSHSQSHLKSEREKSPSVPQNLGSLRPFGCFELTAPFDKLNPFALCEAIAEVIGEPTLRIQSNAVTFLEEVLKEAISSTKSDSAPIDTSDKDSAQLAFYETLLDALCRLAATKSWNIVAGLRRAILMMIDVLGSSWAMQYEVELVHTAVLALKRSGKEIPFAGATAFQFFVGVFVSLYGKPKKWDSVSCVPDVFAIDREIDPPKDFDCGSCNVLSDSVLNILIVELASTKQLVRFAARHALKCHVFDVMTLEEREKKVSSHMSTIKRVLFTRSLRLLPLPEQVAVIDALSTLVDFVPRLIPVADQHLLAFLSEFLKLSSIADGDLSDPSIVGFVVDKNGFTGGMSTSRNTRGATHLTALFLRRECIARLCSDKYISIPEELPLGVQLRVSALRLVNTVIVRHADGFFDADATTTPIGNIRPHVISLIFRSLVSEPPLSVRAAHTALQDVLALSVATKDVGEGTKSQSRLPKELLQTCIRPFLLNLRDYTRLSVPLLRGLARLLSLLASWFNKTLGEKLLEHLQKWMEPELIMDCNIWKVGEEPIIAARILDLFPLLPQASHFVEQLVKTVIKLEAALPRFKVHQAQSPYLKPLARYLNKHPQYAVSFFFQRLKSPIYSELFLSILEIKESEPLRLFLSSRQCCLKILNVCFERPLAIIRSEKTSASASTCNQSAAISTAEMISKHGIGLDPGRQREAELRQDIEDKQKKLLVLQQESLRTKEALQARVPAHSATVEDQDGLAEAKLRCRGAQTAVDRLQKELTDQKQRYAAEIAVSENLDASATKMTIEALELQNQGLNIVKTLVKFNPAYLTEHNDIVRAFRWLWRSKGRHLRLQHEELVPSRFHCESMLLGSLLVDYARVSPSDVDVLFEILRIFLQPTSCDFGFIRSFLAHTVSDGISIGKKKHLIHLFFALLTGEGPEETKVLCIQLIIMPMLLNSSSSVDAARGSPIVDELVDAETTRKFVHEVLLRDGSPVLYGDRTRVELLRLSTLWIRSTPKLVDEHKKDVIKFSWALLKSDDLMCKSWAYINVCSFIEKFETPTKVILQVYVSLMRMYQPEGKVYVRSALSILLSVVAEKLNEKEFRKLIDFTVRLLSEEVNNDPQFAHVWQTITSHPGVFVAHRAKFIELMVNSLSKLGLTSSCPIESKALSISISSLVLEWHGLETSLPPDDDSAVDDCSHAPTKRLKAIDSEPIVTKSTRSLGGRIICKGSLVDKAMVDTLSNFLVKMLILLPDTKAETSTTDLECRTWELLSSVLQKWPMCKIHSVCFDNILTLCIDDARSNKNPSPEPPEKRAREKSKGRSTAKGTNRSSKSVSSKSSQSLGVGRDDGKPVPWVLLSTCLRIFTMLVSRAPNNPFVALNPRVVNEILTACFLQTKHRDCETLRKRLRDFLLAYLELGTKRQTRDPEIDLHIRILLESLLVNSMTSESDSHHSPASLHAQDATMKDEGKFFSFDDGRTGGSCLAYFSLDIIMEICKSSPLFVECFAGSLVALAEQLVANHLQEAGSQSRPGGMSVDYQAPTPITGIIDEALTLSRRGNEPESGSKLSRKPYLGSKRIMNVGTLIKSVVACIRLICLSDVPYCFTKNRLIFMRTLGSILDSSDNIHLLLTAFGIIGKWLICSDGSGPLTKNEKMTFLRKLAHADRRHLPPIASQPLADLVGFITLEIAEGMEIDTAVPIATSDSIKVADCDYSRFPQCFDSPRLLFTRSLVASILCAHSSIRQKALAFYWDIAETSEHVADDDVEAPRARKAGRAAFDLLWQLFHTDFEGVGGRLWPLVFAETLINGCSVLAVPSATVWVPRPNRPRYDGANKSVPQQLVESFVKFMSKFKETTEVQRASVLCLAHCDSSLAQGLFEELLVSAWNQVGSDEARALLVNPMEQLLSRPHYSLGFKKPCGVTNSVQSMLRACRKLHPQPVLDPELLVSLGGIYCATHDVLTILEQEYKVLGPFRTSLVSQKIVSGICRCLQQLGEQDLELGFASCFCTQLESNYVVSLDIHGLVEEAIAGYGELVDVAETRTEQDAMPSDLEMDLWEKRWIILQRELGQLKVVSEFAGIKGDVGMLMDVAWKNQEWDVVDALQSSPELNAASERGDLVLKTSKILSAIIRGKLSEVESLYAQTAQLCLQKWQLSCVVSYGSHRHSSLLHFFHRLVEFRESGQIMFETTTHSNRRTLPDLQNLLRHRLPNDFDELADWDDIVTWRTHMFSSITSHFQWSETGTLSTLHDRPWTMIRMAMTARKQGLRDVAMLSLNRISDTSMDASDAFSKLREQILALYNIDSDLERTAGLNLVNTTNLGYFDDVQKSELFRLKAQFLSSLGGRSKANQAYCHAVQVCPTYAKAWISWGSLCSSLGRLAEKQQAEQLPEPGAGNKENPNAKKVAQYMAQAMGCYLEAVTCDTGEACRVHLPKCLWMLAKDGSAPGVLSQTLESRGSTLPCWVWLPWCPQLLTCLYRHEGKAAKAILTSLAKSYPQALYFPLRAFYLERRDVERSKGASSGSQQSSVIHSEELMSTLRRAHASLWSALEAILEELIVKFRASYEEELLATMAALLERVETQIETSQHSTRDNSENEEAVVTSISKTLGRIGSKFFRETPSDTVLTKRDERARKTEAFREKYKALFEMDFPGFKSQADNEEKIEPNFFLVRLRKWKKMLEEQVSSTPRQLPLVECSQSLAHFCTEAPDLWPMSCDPRAAKELFEKDRPKEDKQNPPSTSASALAAHSAAVTAAIAVAHSAANEGHGGEYGGGSSSIEIPGQYVPNSISAVDSKPMPELHAKLLQFEPRVQVVSRNDQLVRRIGMVGSDGKTIHFLLQFAIPYWTRTDERTVQICYTLEKVFRRDFMCSRNFLTLEPSPVIPIAQRLRMTYESEGRLALDDVLRRRCELAGCGTTVIADYYRHRVKKLCELRKKDSMSPEDMKELLRAVNIDVLREVCEKQVDGTMLLDHVQANLGSAESLFHFRRSFASHLAINSLLQHALFVVVRTPSRLILNEMSGQVFFPEFRLSYNNQGFLESQKVPFRLTPNLQQMLGPIITEGRFIPSMSLTASAIKNNMEDIDSILRLLMRDDIVSWYTSKSMAKSDSKTQELENQLMDRVSKNVSAIQCKISECSIPRNSNRTSSAVTLKTDTINRRVKELVREACSLKTLSSMESSFQPWL